ncbi:MAG: hypothetical protein HDS30_00115 [Bacteroides sp.]|nr:hypothetical protein [Bacteroides sp.]
MNHCKTLLAVILCFFICLPCQMSADNSNNTILVCNSKSNGRPKAPSSQVILCNYDDGYLYVTFVYEEGMCCISVAAIGNSFFKQYVFDSSELSTSFFVGEYKGLWIDIETQSENKYSGQIFY